MENQMIKRIMIKTLELCINIARKKEFNIARKKESISF